MEDLWRRGADGRYERCSTALGCVPPTDHCDPAWARALSAGTELPPEQSIDLVACAGDWMVAEVDAVVTGCQSIEGSTPPAGCRGSGVHTRWFGHFEDGAWRVLASG